MRNRTTIPAVLALLLVGPVLTAAPAWSQDPAREAPPADDAPDAGDTDGRDTDGRDTDGRDTAADPRAAAAEGGDAVRPPGAGPGGEAGGGAAGDTGGPAGGDTGNTAAATPPPAWSPSDQDDRFQDGVPLLGPWPDDWQPARTGQAGLPVIDPLTRDVLDPGEPYVSGPEAGPALPAELLGPVQASAVPGADGTAAPAALRAVRRLDSGSVTPAAPTDPGGSSGVGGTATAPGLATAGPPDEAAGTSRGAAGTPAGSTGRAPAGTEAPGADGPGADGTPQSARRPMPRGLAEDFLPPPPPSGGHRSLGYALLALLAFLSAALTDRLQRRVPGEGLVARVLSAATGIGRGITVPLLFVSALSLLPRSWSLAAPFALVALALAFGWTTRDLLADVFAGIVLTIERRVQSGNRVEVGEHKGVVQALGLRTTRMTVDDGRMVTIPNRRLLAQDMRVDPDAYAPVKVPVNVHPHLSVGEVRQQLQELALLSPYIAPSRPPNVYRDADRPEIWIVEARLVHPRFANAFRGALVELADQVFAGEDRHLPDAAATGSEPASPRSR